MQDYQRRVINELQELDEKRSKLDSFLGCTASVQIEPKGRQLLEEQLQVMNRYSAILHERISLFGLTPEQIESA